MTGLLNQTKWVQDMRDKVLKEVEEKANKVSLFYAYFRFQEEYLSFLTNWLAYLYGRIQSSRPDVIAKALGYGLSQSVRSSLAD